MNNRTWWIILHKTACLRYCHWKQCRVVLVKVYFSKSHCACSKVRFSTKLGKIIGDLVFHYKLSLRVTVHDPLVYFIIIVLLWDCVWFTLCSFQSPCEALKSFSLKSTRRWWWISNGKSCGDGRVVKDAGEGYAFDRALNFLRSRIRDSGV